MKEITNQISKQFINDKVKELVDYNKPVTSLKNIDSFLNDGINIIVECLIDKLKACQKELYNQLDTQIANYNSSITTLKAQIKDYEQDLNTLEQLKAFKRKSKFFNRV